MIPFLLYGSVVLGALVLGVENAFTLDGITFETVAQSLTQYIVGSVALAIILGLLVFIISLLAMIICKRRPSNE